MQKTKIKYIKIKTQAILKIKKKGQMKKMKERLESLGALHTHTHTHTQVVQRIRKEEQEQKENQS